VGGRTVADGRVAVVQLVWSRGEVLVDVTHDGRPANDVGDALPAWSTVGPGSVDGALIAVECRVVELLCGVCCCCVVVETAATGRRSKRKLGSAAGNDRASLPSNHVTCRD
jgi:hypothetical protein